MPADNQHADANDELVYRWVKRSLLAAVFVAAVVLVAYLIAFWGAGCCDQARWGEFGDFVGGTLNPFLGFASVVLLSLTLRAQHRVLEESRRQRVLDELQRLISGASQRLEPLLSAQVDLSNSPLAFLTPDEEIVHLVSRRAADRGEPTVQEIVCEAYVRLCNKHLDEAQVFQIAYSKQFRRLFEHITFLYQCLQRFREEGGHVSIGNLYGARHEELVLLLHALQRMNVPTSVVDFADDALACMGLSSRSDDASVAIEQFLRMRAHSDIDADRLVAQHSADANIADTRGV